jgi:spermidine/putrescine transport system permease protein
MIEKKNHLAGFLFTAFIYFTYLFLYLPVFVIAMFSFNDSAFSTKWKGFSLHWYKTLFSSKEILDALKVSIIVAISATLLSVIIGTCFVVASKYWKKWLSYSFFYPNIVIPDMALAIGVLSVFVLLKLPTGYGSLIIGHTILGLGFVVPIIRTRFSELDPVLTEASLDLGATTTQTIKTILIPLLRPSIIASSLLVFTLSLDDFLIAFFCSNPKVQTISIYVYSQLKEIVDPSINAISVLLMVLSSIIMLVVYLLKLSDMVIHHE